MAFDPFSVKIPFQEQLFVRLIFGAQEQLMFRASIQIAWNG
jgi:hypothetical protein